MNTKKFIAKLKRYLSGNADQAEIKLVDDWYDSFPSHTDIPPLQEGDKQQQLFQRIQSGINNHAPVVRLWHKPIWKAAAVLFIVTSLTLLWWNAANEKHRYNSAYITMQTGSNIKKITLPDSSTVWLNAAGKIRFQRSFSDSSRIVYLDEGEAFFEVKKNPTKPFYVYTGGINTLVLGTSFNIKAYRALRFVKVTVASGTVQVAGNQQNFGRFTPGQQLTYDMLSKTAKRDNQVSGRVDDWKSGKTRLMQAGFDEMALAINNIYHVKLKAGNPSLAGLKYTITLESSQSLTGALLLINAIHDTKTRKEADGITLYK